MLYFPKKIRLHENSISEKIYTPYIRPPPPLPARGSEPDLHSVVDPAPHGAEASPGSGSWVFGSGSQFSLKIWLFNFLPIKVKKSKEKVPYLNLPFSFPYTSEFNFKFSNLNPQKNPFFPDSFFIFAESGSGTVARCQFLGGAPVPCGSGSATPPSLTRLIFP